MRTHLAERPVVAFAPADPPVTVGAGSDPAGPSREITRSGVRPGWRMAGAEWKEAQVPQEAWSPKRERQYEHIKEGLTERGRDEDVAEEIAARTVNKERARAGEAEEASSLSLSDLSSGRRGGLRSHGGSKGRTRDQLYNEARAKGVRGRSSMTKAQLEQAVGRS